VVSVLPRILRTFAVLALSPILTMKRSRPRRSGTLRKAYGEDDITATTTSDSDEQGDASYETDLTEPDDAPSSRKRLRSDEICSSFELGLPGDLGELYNDPLDDDGVDLSEIPEDFDKAPGTIERRERIEGRWKRSVMTEIHLVSIY
jgi:hypothetical protein